jgi:hypothetical protein
MPAAEDCDEETHLGPGGRPGSQVAEVEVADVVAELDVLAALIPDES